MKIKLISIGKTRERWLVEALSDYQARLAHYLPFESIELELRLKESDRHKIVEAESARIVQQIRVDDFLVLLDSTGKSYRSEQFAIWLQKQMNASSRNLVFVIGGAWGFSEALRERAQESLSLSSMTFTHQMVRLVFTEQLYRACTIMRNESYHH